MAPAQPKLLPPAPQPTQAEIDMFVAATRDNRIAEVAATLNRFGTAIIDKRATDKDTALSWAAWLGYEEMTKMLLDRGADINLGEREGRTPLHCAAQTNRPKIAEILIERGARLDIRDDRGRTPLQVAEEFKRTAIIAAIRAREAALERRKQERLRQEEEARQAVRRDALLKAAKPRHKPFKNKPPKP